MSFLALSGCTDNNDNGQDNQQEEDSVEESTQTDEDNDLNGELEEDENNSSDSDSEESDSESESEVEDENEDEVEEDENTVSIDMEDDLLNPDSVKVLVNKQYALPEDYAPEDLVTVEVPTVLENPEIRQLREVASDALTEMFAAAEEEGIILHARSGYRSYQTQVQLFNSYVENHGEEAANRYSARPGESEHQTGLAMDVTSESANYQLSEEFGSTPEGIWVEENAHEFGFVIRYPEGTEDITGYQYEPWHLRYFGEELALDIYESGLTYEEYLIERGIDIETGE
ncbi:MAG: D-alanyl-D-alanine carboxypeptidase family protein [Alkalibacterium sp.]|nr:MAG: D-alanyl-D-alanine carboxypeptidase family protein [Alkalibacterium sp.]